MRGQVSDKDTVTLTSTSMDSNGDEQNFLALTLAEFAVVIETILTKPGAFMKGFSPPFMAVFTPFVAKAVTARRPQAAPSTSAAATSEGGVSTF